MTKFLAVTLFILSITAFSQNRIKILDAESQKPISYAKLTFKDKHYYKNTEENGEITLEKSEEIFEIQSFGYEDFKVQQNQPTYLLQPKFTNIDEVRIPKPKFSKTFTIGKVSKENSFYGVHNTIWMVAKELRNDISEAPLFIESIKFYSRLFSKKSAIIKINIYYNENGIPGDLYKSVIVTCVKKQKITEFIFPKPFTLPKEGIIVGFEWILNQENSYQKMMMINGEKKETIGHDPMIGSLTENPKNIILGNLSQEGWIFVNGSNNSSQITKNLGIELKLTN